MAHKRLASVVTIANDDFCEYILVLIPRLQIKFKLQIQRCMHLGSPSLESEIARAEYELPEVVSTLTRLSRCFSQIILMYKRKNIQWISTNSNVQFTEGSRFEI